MERRGSGQAVAPFDVLGCPFEELGEATAGQWRMPGRVVTAIHMARASPSVDMLGLTAFAPDLPTAVNRRGVDPARDGVSEVMARSAKRLKLSRDQVGGLLQSALRETKATFASANVTLHGLSLRQQKRLALPSLGATDRGSADDAMPDALGGGVIGDDDPPRGALHDDHRSPPQASPSSRPSFRERRSAA